MTSTTDKPVNPGKHGDNYDNINWDDKAEVNQPVDDKDGLHQDMPKHWKKSGVGA